MKLLILLVGYTSIIAFTCLFENAGVDISHLNPEKKCLNVTVNKAFKLILPKQDISNLLWGVKTP